MRRALALALGVAACDGALDRRLAIVDGPRVLAVLAEPAEARPSEPVAYAVVVGGPDGPIDAAPRWAYCTSPKPPTEDNAVAEPCVRGEELIELGEAPTVTAALPADACVRFGPDTPPGEFRPRDADPTGGYYQPVRVADDTLLAFGLSRITCKLPGAAPELARRYELEYVANQNPTLEPVALPATVPADTDVELIAAWPARAAESYLYFDPLAQALVTRRESLRLSWFATGGTLAVDATAVAEDDPATAVATTWRTPGPGPAWLWFVLRDSRGGSAVQLREVTVE